MTANEGDVRLKQMSHLIRITNPLIISTLTSVIKNQMPKTSDSNDSKINKLSVTRASVHEVSPATSERA